MMALRFSVFGVLLLALYTSIATCAAQEPLIAQPGYKVGQPIAVSCLNRTM
jgi:hypothetical protein